MTAETLAAAQARHPLWKRVAFIVPGRSGGRSGTGEVLGHRDTSRGPFITVYGALDTGGKLRDFSARPANVRDA